MKQFLIRRALLAEIEVSPMTDHRGRRTAHIPALIESLSMAEADVRERVESFVRNPNCLLSKRQIERDVAALADFDKERNG